MSLLHLHASNLHAGVVVLRGIVGAGDQRALDSLQHVRQFRASQVNQAPLPGRCSRRRVCLSRARSCLVRASQQWWVLVVSARTMIESRERACGRNKCTRQGQWSPGRRSGSPQSCWPGGCGCQSGSTARWSAGAARQRAGQTCHRHSAEPRPPIPRCQKWLAPLPSGACNLCPLRRASQVLDTASGSGLSQNPARKVRVLCSTGPAAPAPAETNVQPSSANKPPPTRNWSEPCQLARRGTATEGR